MEACTNPFDANHGPGLTDEQQIIRLQEFFAQVYEQKPEQFECGQIVWHKHPSLSSIEAAEHPMIFIEYLEDPINGTELARDVEDLSHSGSGGFVDCRLGVIWSGSFCTFLMDSREFSTTKPRTAGE